MGHPVHIEKVIEKSLDWHRCNLLNSYEKLPIGYLGISTVKRLIRVLDSFHCLSTRLTNAIPIR